MAKDHAWTWDNWRRIFCALCRWDRTVSEEPEPTGNPCAICLRRLSYEVQDAQRRVECFERTGSPYLMELHQKEPAKDDVASGDAP